jgi:hypothetical protein
MTKRSLRERLRPLALWWRVQIAPLRYSFYGFEDTVRFLRNALWIERDYSCAARSMHMLKHYAPPAKAELRLYLEHFSEHEPLRLTALKTLAAVAEPGEIALLFRRFPDYPSRRAIFDGLQPRGTEVAALGPDLLPLLDYAPTIASQLTLIESLQCVAPDMPEVIERLPGVLDSAMADDTPSLRGRALKLIASFGTGAADLAERLVAQIGIERQTGDEKSLADAITAAGCACAGGQLAELLTEALIPCLGHSSKQAAFAAFESLAKLGPRAAPAVPALLLEILSSDPFHRRAAQMALNRIVKQANDDDCDLPTGFRPGGDDALSLLHGLRPLLLHTV